jgi:hypothetical protein
VSGLVEVTNAAVRQGAAGYDGIWTPESKHDPFLPLVVAAGWDPDLRTREAHRSC